MIDTSSTLPFLLFYDGKRFRTSLVLTIEIFMYGLARRWEHVYVRASDPIQFHA
jgi:hypothetical protein